MSKHEGLRAAVLLTAPPGRLPGQRFRVEQWLDLLPGDAVDPSLLELYTAAAYGRLHRPGGTLGKVADTLTALGRRAGQVAAAGRSEVAYLYREAFLLGPAVLERFLAHRVPLVFDFDDAIWLPSASEANAALARLKVPSKVSSIIARSTAVITGNEYLATYARRFNEAVTVIPTTLDVDRYRPQPRADRDLVRIGWSGSPTTARYLSALERPLRRALAELPVELVISGAPGFRLPGAERVHVIPWRAETEVADVGTFDIGLMPLPDDEWSRGKCGFKALLYMSLGVPAVVSPVGVNTEIVADGDNGLWATNEDEWFDAIARLVASPDLRASLGAAGRATVVERYSGQQWAPRFLSVLQQAAGRA